MASTEDTTTKTTAPPSAPKPAARATSSNNANANANASTTIARPKPQKKATQFGKADPVRDASIVAGFFAFMFFLSWMLNNVGNPNVDPSLKINTMSSLKKMKRAIGDSIKLEMEGKSPRYDCELFLGLTSLRGGGLGVFAGKNYTKGQVVMSAGLPWMPIVTENHDNDNPLFLPPFALILKHHPWFTNIEHVDLAYHGQDPSPYESPQLKASRDIAVGEELFIPFEKMHPQSFTSLFATIPQYHDYLQANEIIQDERIQLKATSRNFPRKRQPEVGMALRMTQRAVARYNPVVASLLPNVAKGLLDYIPVDATSLVHSVQNYTHQNLAYFSQCLDDIEWHHQNQTIVAKRSVPKGKPLASLPLYAIQQQQQQHTKTSCSAVADEEQEACDATDRRYHEGCFGQVGSSLQLCPLSHGPIRVISISTSSAEEAVIVDNDNEEPNAEYQWSAWNEDNKKRKSLTPLELTKSLTAGLSWDLIALQDIEPGQEIVVAMNMDSSGRFELPDELFSLNWKDLV